jgi:hypothetical protein
MVLCGASSLLMLKFSRHDVPAIAWPHKLKLLFIIPICTREGDQSSHIEWVSILEAVFPILPGLHGNNHKQPHQNSLYKSDEGGDDKQPM